VRVLFLTAGLAPDDPTPAARAHAAWLHDVRRHHTTDLVVGYRRDRRLVPSDALGVDLCGRRGLGAAWALRRATWRRARTFDPHVVLSTQPQAPRCGRPAVALVAHAPEVQAAGLGARARLTRLAAFERVVVESETVQQALIKGGLPAERVIVSPPGRHRVRRDAGEPERLRLVCLGPIAPARGQHLAIDAVARLAPVEKARVQLDVIGHVQDPVYLGHLHVQAHQQPVDLLPDPQTAADPLAHAHGLLSLPLQAPDLDLDLGRALVSDVPVVWSDIDGMRPLTAGLGQPVPPNDVGAVQAWIRRLLDDREALDQQAREHGEQARAWLGRPAAEERMRRLLVELQG